MKKIIFYCVTILTISCFADDISDFLVPTAIGGAVGGAIGGREGAAAGFAVGATTGLIAHASNKKNSYRDDNNCCQEARALRKENKLLNKEIKLLNKDLNKKEILIDQLEKENSDYEQIIKENNAEIKNLKKIKTKE